MLKKVILYHLIIISIFAAYLSSCSDTDNQGSTDPNWVTLAIETERYIHNAKYTSPNGTTWKTMPDSAQSEGSIALYDGTPGIVLFYLELFNVTNDSLYLREAISGADYLVNTIPDSMPGINNVGLYTGLAGIGFTLIEIYKVTFENRYKEASMRLIDLLEMSAENSTHGIHWGQISDIVYGSAGIGLFLHYASDELKLSKADSLSFLVAEGLLDQAESSRDGLRWKYTPDRSQYTDNFSHGTSGVAFFLSQTYQRTKNERYLEASIKAARMLEVLSNEKGYVPHHFPEGEDLYYLSWCHGPAGTSRLYYSLYESTKDELWLDKVKFSANNLMQEGIEMDEKPGYWNNVGKCCGTVGVAEYYLWLYELTGIQDYLQFSNKMTESMLSKATRENNYTKWLNAENRIRPDELVAQTGLMQGSAGIGLWFLKLNANQNNQKPLIQLPDKPKVWQGK